MNAQTILLAEDSNSDAELTVAALRRMGIARPIVRVRDGVEVLEHLLAQDASGTDSRPALLFLDLRMPRLDGFDVLKAIRADERARSLPVIILTCSDEEKLRLGAYDDRVTGIACKPIDRDQLAATTGKLGLGWLMGAQRP